MAARVDLLAPAVVRVAASVCPGAGRARHCARPNRESFSSPGQRTASRRRPDASAPTPLRSRRPSRPGSFSHPTTRRIPPMLSLHPLSRKVMRLGIAACGLAALAACGDNSLTGLRTVDLNLSRVAGFDQLKAALVQARNEANGGFNLDMWAAGGDRNGLVVAVVFTGATNTDQGPGSRVIAAQKGNTGNAFSLPHLALSTANLYAATQPGGTLFGLQESNPTNEEVAYGGNPADYGRRKGVQMSE